MFNLNIVRFIRESAIRIPNKIAETGWWEEIIHLTCKNISTECKRKNMSFKRKRQQRT